MKIITTFTYHYLKIFKDIFVPSLPDNTELIFQYHNYNLRKCENRLGVHDTFYKIPFLLKTLESCEENELLFYADIDIVFLNKDLENIVKNLEEKDLYIQLDDANNGVCLGCMALRNTENTRNIFKRFLDLKAEEVLKQYGFSLYYFKHLLNTENINWAHLPLEFYGGQMIQHNLDKPENIYLYHATFENGTEGKYNKLKEYYKSIYPKRKLKFLILLTYYNRPKLVKNALESIKRLKYDNWELVVIDDASEQSIEELCKEYVDAKKLKYYRIKDTIEKKIKRGGSNHGKYMNKAIQESNADIVIPLCDDDALMEDYLNKLNDYFDTNVGVKYVYSNDFIFDPQTENPFDIKERRGDFGYNVVPVNPSGKLDFSQVVFRIECFNEDGLSYPFPQTKNLDEQIFKQAYEKYSVCPYSGFFGQYKALYSGQLGVRENIYNYIDKDGE